MNLFVEIKASSRTENNKIPEKKNKNTSRHAFGFGLFRFRDAILSVNVSILQFTVECKYRQTDRVFLVNIFGSGFGEVAGLVTGVVTMNTLVSHHFTKPLTPFITLKWLLPRYPLCNSRLIDVFDSGLHNGYIRRSHSERNVRSRRLLEVVSDACIHRHYPRNLPKTKNQRHIQQT